VTAAWISFGIAMGFSALAATFLLWADRDYPRRPMWPAAVCIILAGATLGAMLGFMERCVS
jgi:hypothetical protein